MLNNKQDSKWRNPRINTLSLESRSLLSKFHTASRYKRKCHFIYVSNITFRSLMPIKLNANLMQLDNFINIFLARHVSGAYTHHQQH